MDNNHRPKLTGSCLFIENLEREIKKIPGIIIWKEGGQRSDVSLFEPQQSFRSPVFQRVYFVPIGYQGIRTLVLRVKVFYNYRDQWASLEASNPGELDKLFNKRPELQVAVQEALTHSNGHKMLDVRMLSNDRAEIIFTCPRCRVSVPHTCGEEPCASSGNG